MKSKISSLILASLLALVQHGQAFTTTLNIDIFGPITGGSGVYNLRLGTYQNIGGLSNNSVDAYNQLVAGFNTAYTVSGLDGAALATALEAGEIEAAALDVTEKEPIDPDDALLKLPNCIVTPHIAGFSPVFLDDCPRRQAENIIRVLTGEPPHGLANPEVIKTIAVMRDGDAGRWEGVPDFSTALRL